MGGFQGLCFPFGVFRLSLLGIGKIAFFLESAFFIRKESPKVSKECTNWRAIAESKKCPKVMHLSLYSLIIFVSTLKLREKNDTFYEV